MVMVPVAALALFVALLLLVLFRSDRRLGGSGGEERRLVGFGRLGRSGSSVWRRLRFTWRQIIIKNYG
jgi:hypothetical protein